MKTTLRTLTFAAAFATAGLAHGADVEYIANFGDDGDAVYYQVRCSDKRTVSLRVLNDTKQACYSTRDGEKCLGSGSVREAADAACR